MSDPVTNVEIEDVLSSIRRLVSQDGRARPAVLSNAEPEVAPEEVPVAVVEEDGAEALVLTQDHRIDEVDSDAEAAGLRVEDARREAATAVRSELERAIEELEAAMGIADRDAPASAFAAPAQQVAEPEAPEEHHDDSADLEAADDEIDWEAPVGRAMEGVPPSFEEPAEEFDPDQQPKEASFEEGEAPAPDEVAEDAEEGWDVQSEEAFDAGREAEDDADHADVEEAEELQADAVEEDASDDSEPVEEAEFFEYVPAAPDEAVEEVAEDVEAAAEDDVDGDAGAAEAYESPAEEEVEEPEDSFEAELEAEIDGAPEQEALPEPEAEAAAEPGTAAPFFAHSAFERLHLVSDGGEAADVAYSGQYDETYDDGLADDPIPAQVEASLADQADYFEAPEGPFDSAKDDRFPGVDAEDAADQVVALDEEQLRDMVAEIVREELQGELGERITRNVRKLVRREINRALAGQDLI
ncbi:MAG: hypothetical protein MK180_08310 [Rhodobacteraceae bacterium]|nr:hypothetical protein [Paracoccaceae bacterium]